MNPSNTTKFYNPKSRSPAVYIECWLIQVPTKLVSNNAKILYGRLAQWSDGKGDVYRSLPQLSQELGTPVGTLEKHLRELKSVGLIATFHPQAGGVNHYRFLYHPWMDEPINDNLVYKSDPPPNPEVPSSKSGGTPPPNLEHINKKEIRINNTVFFEFFSVWNQVAAAQELKPINFNNNREVERVKIAINKASIFWPEINKLDAYRLHDNMQLTPESFRVYLEECILCEWYMLCGTEPHSIETILKQSNFEKGILKIKKQQKDNRS